MSEKKKNNKNFEIPKVAKTQNNFDRKCFVSTVGNFALAIINFYIFHCNLH